MKTVRDILERCDISNNQTKDPLTVDQALKELEELLLECKPEKQLLMTKPPSYATEEDILVVEAQKAAYNQAIDDYEKNKKKVIGGK